MDIEKMKEQANALHISGYNCAQSVLAACGELTGMDEKTALAVTGGFGGGMRCGEICGCISGAIAAVGITNPFDASDAAAKAKTAELTKKVIKAYTDKYGCLRCFDLKAKGYPCSELISFGVETAVDVITNNK